MRELSLHILDLAENALEAGADRIELTIDEDLAADRLTITVGDNGRGMSEEQLRRISDPFFTSRKTRHVGLGIPLCRAAAERCNGSLSISSEPGKGTTVQVTFQHSHIDRAPLGDLSGALLAILLSERASDLSYAHRVDAREFAFDTADIRTELGDTPLAHPAVRRWLRSLITAGEQGLWSSEASD